MDPDSIEQLVKAIDGVRDILWWIALWLFVKTFST